MGNLRAFVRRQRRSGARWIRAADALRECFSSRGRARLWLRLRHAQAVHQLTEYTEEERYPALFDFAMRAHAGASRILSFGCSTGEELDALRRRFPNAQIIGAEINPRSRALAQKRVAGDPDVTVVSSYTGQPAFDLIFALAVLQFEPDRIEAEGVMDLSSVYPFARFDQEITRLVACLREGGLLVVTNTQYRVEDCSAYALLAPEDGSTPIPRPLFQPSGRRYPDGTVGLSVFRKQEPT